MTSRQGEELKSESVVPAGAQLDLRRPAASLPPPRGPPPFVRAPGKREKDCVNLRDNVKPKDCRAALSNNGFRGAFFYDDNKNSYVKKDTVLSRDAVVTELTDAEVRLARR